MKDFLTVKEFAELANKKPQTIYKQLDKRLKPYVKSEKGQLVISSEALEVFYDIETKNQPISTADQPNSTQNQPNSTRIDLDSTDNQPISTAEDQLESTDDNENPKGFSQENGQIEALNKLIE